MKTLNMHELEAIYHSLQFLLDSKIQQVHCFLSGYVLECFKNNKIFYWIFDLSQDLPYTGCFEKSPVPFIKKTKPLLLFLKAHGVGKRISSIEVDQLVGRGLRIAIGYENILTLQVRLFPHGANLIATASGKSISENRIKEIPQLQPIAASTIRSIDELNTEWKNKKTTFSKSRSLNGVLSSNDPSEASPAMLKLPESYLKKQKTLTKLMEAEKKMDSNSWYQAGEWLRNNLVNYNGSSRVGSSIDKIPENILSHLNPKKTFLENLDYVFLKAKEIVAKREGLIQRIKILKDELELEKTAADTFSDEPSLSMNASDATKENSSLAKIKSSLRWGNGYELYVGRNAADNLKILRSAKPWHLWIHLKDYPGAHGILQFSKNQYPQLADIEKASQWVAERSKKSLHHIRAGDVFDVLVCEKRFIKPIKGDLVGRVRYSNEKVYSFKKN